MSSPVISSQYQRFLKVLEKWPIDKTKLKRDLGEHLRKHVKELLNSPAGFTDQQAVQLTRQISSLERLANNTYNNKYKRLHSSTATGLSAEICSQVLSSESLEFLNEEKGFFSKE